MSALDAANWARTVGAFQEVYSKSTSAPAPVAPPTPPVVVQRGDTLSQIAKDAGISLKELYDLNPKFKSDPKYAGGNTIFSGTKVNVAPKPAKVTTPTPEPDPRGDNTPGSDGQPEEPPTEDNKPPTEDNKPPSGGGGAATTFVDPTAAATASVNEQILALQTQIAAMQSAAAAEAAKPKVVGQKTVRKTGGVVEVYQTMSDGTQGSLIESYKDFGARDSVMKMFENTGLGQAYIDSLMTTIDKVYEENIMPTDAQVLNSIYNSQAYKTRFAANEAIKKRMADGKGRPGDRLLTPYEYIQTEKAYEEILREAGLPTGFYDQQEDFTNFISAGISTAELTDRVNIARNALNNADEGIKTALKDYYGLTNEDLTAYLLDKDRAINLIDSRFRYTTEEAKKMYTSAEIGGAALRAGQMSDKAFAEEIYTAGKAGQAESAFQTAATQQRDYRRLMGLYGETAGEQDIAREELALAGGTDVTVKKKRLASQERAMFQQKSAIDTSSLGRRSKTADV